MKLTFLGATRIVTGSCYLLEANGKKLLVDCGMFQGSKVVEDLNKREFLFNPGEIDAVILTHAHIDHSGLLPKLVKQGFSGNIHCTKSTQQLCTILLPDSAHIQESDAETANRKGQRSGADIVTPIYSIDDAYETLNHFMVHEFHEPFEVYPGINVNFKVAGHILGSSVIELKVHEDGKDTKLIFTGDVGQPNQPIIEDPENISGADFVITESTYGNRVHEVYDKEADLAKIVNEVYERGGNLIIPAFAVGRTQVLLYYFQKMQQHGLIPEIPIYIDSPMATKVTGITLQSKDEYDEETKAITELQGNNLYAMKNVRFTATAEESRMINSIDGPKIILSASGMANAGRILHHLKHNLWRPECGVLFAGFQADGTTGRRLLDGVKKIKILGETISVAATIYNMRGFSAHADKDQLLAWYEKKSIKPKSFFVTHSELDAATEFSQILHRNLGCATYVPQFGDVAEISGNDYKITESAIVSEVPEVLLLREYLKSFEADYMRYRTRI